MILIFVILFIFRVLSKKVDVMSKLSKFVPIFANLQDDYKMRSSIEHSFDQYRKELSQYMNILNEKQNYMKEIDEKTSILIYIHQQFYDYISQIPISWDQNEQVLRNLVSINQASLVRALLPEKSNHIYTDSILFSLTYQLLSRLY
jgi:hypothetical protein